VEGIDVIKKKMGVRPSFSLIMRRRFQRARLSGAPLVNFIKNFTANAKNAPLFASYIAERDVAKMLIYRKTIKIY
jgi:hypothetical protein